MQKVISKNELSSFVNSLIKKYEVYAPVKELNTKFRKIENAKEIYMNALTDVSAKQLFIPENEVLVEFKDGKAIEATGEIKKRVIFGMRKCDLNAVKILDKVMFDSQYRAKRENTILIGLFCEHPDDYCFCNSMELEDYHDLFFYPKGENYYISIGSKKGEELVKNLKTVKEELIIPDPKNKKKLTTQDIEKAYRNSIWEGDSEKCLSCSACTIDCPTCNCFDIFDELDIEMKNGTRKRRQASCMTKSFSRVSGGKSFRDSRVSRFKQFVYHKIVYYKKQHGKSMCVGCGRCLRVCPTKIDWVNSINLLEDFKEAKKK